MAPTLKLSSIIFISILLGYLNAIRLNSPFITPPVKQKATEFEEMTKKLPLGVQAATLKEAHAIFSENSHIIIDARRPESFQQGHIEDAENLPISKIEKHLVNFMDTYPLETPLLLYCSSLHCDSSTRLASELKDVGYTNITVFLEGWIEWRKQILKK